MKVVIKQIRDEAVDIRSYQLEAVEGETLPSFTAGSHIDVFINDDLSRQYSISSSPSEDGYYRVGIQKDANSTGGSVAIFENFKQDQIIEISEPRNHFKLKEDGDHFTLIGGGIGVTPIMAMAQRLAELGKSFKLLYLVRSEDRIAFREDLARSEIEPHVTIHKDDEQGLPDLKALIGDYDQGRQIYCCGPTPLMDAVRDTTLSWPPMSVHFEHFTAEQVDGDMNEPFEVQLGQDGPVLEVASGQTLLEVLRDRGIVVETQCTQGLCGTCEQVVLDGEVDHRDLVLEDDEKAENSCMMVCVSRALSKRLVLDIKDPSDG